MKKRFPILVEIFFKMLPNLHSPPWPSVTSNNHPANAGFNAGFNALLNSDQTLLH